MENKEFKWDDATVSEFAEFYRKKQGVDYTTWGKCILDEFKKTKTKKPLFITDDGKEIFEGDMFFYVSDAGDICETRMLCELDGDFSKSKKFSTFESANECVLNSKPCLSFNDICGLWAIDKQSREALIKLVIQKIEKP